MRPFIISRSKKPRLFRGLTDLARSRPPDFPRYVLNGEEHKGERPTRTVRLPLLACAAAITLLGGCATPFDNQPRNLAITPAFIEFTQRPRGIVGEHVIGLSLSGGGMRAAAFGLGVMQAITAADQQGSDLFEDLSFISSVSGGSLTAAYVALNGRAGVDSMRQAVLEKNLERDLRLSMFSPLNLVRLLAGGVNDRSNMAATLDADIFKGATFADLYRRKKPDVWINATDLYNRTPFPFIPEIFNALCSDLSQLGVSEAVAASMAVPLAFTPVVLKTFPQQCLTPQPPDIDQSLEDPGSVIVGSAVAAARAVRNYRDPARMRYIKLVDGGLSDNQGLTSILIARAVAGTPYGPLSQQDAVNVRRMLFLIVDAGRPTSGDWARSLEGPSGVEVGIAAADSAIDSATRLSAAAFRPMLAEWRDSVVRFRCGLSPAQRRALMTDVAGWRCDDVQFLLGTVSIESLEPERAMRLRDIPTRLVLPSAQIDDVVSAGREATLLNPAFRAYVAGRAASRPAASGN